MDLSEREEMYRQLKEQLDKYSSSDKFPPWYKRKAESMIQSLSHPDFGRDIGILLFCDKNSVLESYQKLLGYFVRNYGLDSEIVETWIMYASTSKMELMMGDHQMWPSILFNDQEKVAWPAENPQEFYKHLKTWNERQPAYVDLHIGRSSTKQDIIWIIDNLWDSEIEPHLHKISNGIASRPKPKYFRNSTIYYLRKSGMRIKDIVAYINDHFPEAVSEENVKKALRDFTSNHPDWFEKANDQVQRLSESKTGRAMLYSRILKLTFEQEPAEHFLLK